LVFVIVSNPLEMNKKGLAKVPFFVYTTHK